MKPEIFYTVQFMVMQLLCLQHTTTPFRLVLGIAAIAVCWAPWFILMKNK